MKISDIAVLGALAISSPSVHADQECKPGSPGYQEFPALSWLPTLSRTCTISLTENVALKTQAAFSKATVAGKDTGTLRSAELQPVIRHVHSEARNALETVIKEKGSGIVDEGAPEVNLSGKVIVGASPDMNLTGGTLKTVSGQSAILGLYTQTTENMQTARLRCDTLLQAIPTTIQSGGKNIKISTNGLDCIPDVKVLDIQAWSARLTSLGVELMQKGMIPPTSMDDAQIFAAKLANKNTIPADLSAESKKTITDLAKEFEAMRVVPMNGTLGVTIRVNETFANWSGIVSSLAIIALALFIAGGIGSIIRGKKNTTLRTV